MVTAQVNDITSPTVLTTTTTTASSGRVGINTNTPTQTLDVVGNGRFRNLEEGHNSTNFPRFVVSKEDGTLGYTIRPTKTPIVIIDHVARGLAWNTKKFYPNNATQPDAGDPLNTRNISGRPASNAGEQDNLITYYVFGAKSDISGAERGRFTNDRTSFDVVAGDVINVDANINLRVLENFVAKPLISTSPNGDRQIILNLFLYKGNTLITQTKQVINFNGRNDATKNDTYPFTYTSNYISTFSQNLGLTHSVPNDGGGNYSVSVTVTARAPRDGQFRIDLAGENNSLRQKLIVTRL